MEWTRPGIRRHFDFQGRAGEERKRYIITLQITNKDSEHNLAILHIPFEQDGWFIEPPTDVRPKVTIKGLKVEEGEESWTCHTELPHPEDEHRGLLFYSTTRRKWGAYLECCQAATIILEASVTSDEPLVKQTLTLGYFPDLGWQFDSVRRKREPVLKPSPYYSSNTEIEEGQLA